MRKIVLYMFTSLDGFVAGPNGEFDDYEPSPEEHTFANQFFGAAAGIMFGRITYEGFVAYGDALDLSDASTPAVEIEFAKLFREKRRVVFSRTLDQVADNAILIKDNLAAEVAKLKQQPDGYYGLVCGPALLATLVQLDMVDEYWILVKPTILGRGKALFGDIQQKLRLKLLSTRVFASGTVMHQYQRE